MGCPNLHISENYEFNFEGISDFSSCKKVRIVNFLESKKVVVDYSPFGVELYQRGFTRDEYRYGFQGQESDNEIKGNGNSVNYKYRMHDPRLGRFFAVDPLVKEYPELTPYQFSSNNPIGMIEIEGLEGTPAAGQVTKPKPIIKLWKVKNIDAVNKDGKNFADKSKSRLVFGRVPRTRTVNQWRTIFTATTITPGTVNQTVPTNTNNPVRASISRPNFPGRSQLNTPGANNSSISFNMPSPTPNFVSQFLFNPGQPNDGAPIPQLGITTIPQLGTPNVTTVTFNYTLTTPGVTILYDIEELTPVTTTRLRLGFYRESADRTNDTDNTETESQQTEALGVESKKSGRKARRKALRATKKKL